MPVSIDPIILGDNQFFGVNHLSEDKGRDRWTKFRDLMEIKRVLFHALDHGVHAVMFSTHPAVYDIAEMIRRDATLKRELSFYINVPYIMKYVSMVNQMGPLKTVRTVLEGKTLLGTMAYFGTLLRNFVAEDYLGLANRLVDVEIAPFHDLNIRAVFLHNALCDLALGYNMTQIVRNFDEYVRHKYGVIPAYGTLNYPLFCKFLSMAGIKDSLIMTAVNKKGFFMNPSREAVERAIAASEHTVLAMATLASGSLKPEEAYEYLFSLDRVKNVVVGISSAKHAAETFGIIRNFL